MNLESEARVELGLFLRGFRENFFVRMGQKQKNELSRRRLAGRSETSEDVIIKLEHGVVNPERAIFERVIKSLKLSDEDSLEANRLLDIFSTKPPIRVRKRVKLHSNFSIRSRRRPVKKIGYKK